MKKFVFSLGRVADWRRAQARQEEIKLESLHAERRALDAREAALKHELAASERALLAAPRVTGFETAALDAFRRHVNLEQVRIARALADCGNRVAAQQEVVRAKRRDIRLLENLKEQRLKAWRAELGRETAQQADETYLAKWNAREV
jgi:hypothetical protein